MERDGGLVLRNQVFFLGFSSWNPDFSERRPGVLATCLAIAAACRPRASSMEMPSLMVMVTIWVTGPVDIVAGASFEDVS